MSIENIPPTIPIAEFARLRTQKRGSAVTTFDRVLASSINHEALLVPQTVVPTLRTLAYKRGYVLTARRVKVNPKLAYTIVFKKGGGQ